MQDRTLRWQVFVVAVVVIWDIVATSCRDRGVEGDQHREGGSPGRARRRCWWDSQWWCSVVASMDPGARGQLCSGLADGRAVCLGVCSLWRRAGLLRGVVCAGAGGDLSGGTVERRCPLELWGEACVVLVFLGLRGWGEVQGAREFDRAERWARWDEVDLVFVGAGEQGDWCRCGLPGAVEAHTQRQWGNREVFKLNTSMKQSLPHLLKSFNLLTALWRLSLEHVTVVGFWWGGKLGQWWAASTVCEHRDTGSETPEA